MTRHIPVLLDEVITYLEPTPTGRYLDGTVGGGGHAEAILEASAPAGQVLGLDRDPDAVDRLKQGRVARQPNLILRRGSYAEAPEILAELGWPSLTGALLDLGLSSDQLNDSDRGFSFRSSGPLDLRFNQQAGQSASERLARWSVPELAEILERYGELTQSRKLAERIKAAGRIRTTADLIQASGLVHPRRRAQLFQALRIATNDELTILSQGLSSIWSVLDDSGRLLVITFQSLEDRIVKQFFNQKVRADEGKLLVKKPIRPTLEEQRRNPRARSAKLRVIEKTGEK